MPAVFGNDRQRGTLRFLSYHALYQETRAGFVIYAGSVKDGERLLGLQDGQVNFDPAGHRKVVGRIDQEHHVRFV